MLVSLGRNGLLKDPALRLKFVDWPDFDAIRKKGVTADAKDMLRRRQAQYLAGRDDIGEEQRRRVVFE